jgi:ADP-ribose pyrophosphatase YjhB (NUDIX family)
VFVAQDETRNNETYEESVTRELKEETNIDYNAHKNNLILNIMEDQEN